MKVASPACLAIILLTILHLATILNASSVTDALKKPFQTARRGASSIKEKIRSRRHGRHNSNSNSNSSSPNDFTSHMLPSGGSLPFRVPAAVISPVSSMISAFPSLPGSNWLPAELGGSSSSSSRSSSSDGGSSSTVASGQQASGDEDLDFEAKCFVDRGESLSQSPSVHFYSSSKHSPQTLGCNETTRIELNTNPETDELQLSRAAINALQYNGRLPTYFLTHGFMSSWNGNNWMCAIKDLVLNNSQANVFIVDWSGGAKPMLPVDYAAAVSNTKYVGQRLAAFINYLLQISGQRDASNFHLIGHSLGAHISGFVGYAVENLGRITGLDPAGPCFTTNSQKQEQLASNTGQLASNSRRLSPASAQLVVALHTDTELFGLNENCAHYDIYVNGGYRQPRCPTVSLKNRFADLLNFDLKKSINPNIACAHSYAHQLLDKFASLFDGRKQAQQTINARQLSSQEAGALLELQENKCYPVAYECDDWNTFKSGECGFCYDRDTRCVFTGLSYEESLRPLQKRVEGQVDQATIGRLKSNADQTDDDDKFNDEDEQPGDDSYTQDDDKFIKPPSDVNSRGQHFMRAAAGGKSATCLYHYQVIVAAKKSQVARLAEAQRYYYYLHIPLEESGVFNAPNGSRLHDRLLQVSHRVEPGSRTHTLLVNNYAARVRERNPKIYLQVQDIEFYTALVTFAQAPAAQCVGGDQDGASESDKWQLCRPLDSLKEARLWSSSGEKLEAIEWVAMNYMSGLTYEQRISHSYVFGRENFVLRREQIDESELAQMNDLTPTLASTTSNVFKDKFGCFLSKLDAATSAAESNFKCGRSNRELKYAVNLRPVNL